MSRGPGWARGVLLVALLGLPSLAGASIELQDAWNNGNAQSGSPIFPNWGMVYVGAYDVWLYDVPGSPETIKGLTLMNFGTAVPGDLSRVLLKMSCGATSSGLLTMTYAGLFTEDSGTHPAWTWAGSSPDFSGCADLCGAPACGGYFSIDVYVDVSPCPTSGRTVSMGFPTNYGGDPLNWGSITDNQGFTAPSGDLAGDLFTIMYVYKKGPSTVVPGDTMTYTVYYGKPGTSPLTGITVMDSLPPYTHYVTGSGVPAPDVGWDPSWGPPIALQWNTGVTGNLPLWGPTSELRFSISVDWGNGEGFEPGSGDVAAPEGVRLANQAQVFFQGIAGCGNASMVNEPVSTVAKRFIFWTIGDNDVLFSPTYGQPPDEMIYSTFIRNLSTTKTWWDVHLWDTVPTDLNPWAANMGFDDPCLGWTMTPGGCANASPGRSVSAGKTLLTWRMDMPPGMTVEFRWKASVSPVAQANGTVINTLSVLEYGRQNIINGTGHSGQPRFFVHLAPIILPTTYTSYVGYGAGGGSCPGQFLDFFPLNKKTQFELRAIQYQGLGFATVGGVSQSIGCYIGDCFNGFPGSAGCALGAGAIPGGAGSLAGCKVERIPAKYDPPHGAYGDLTGFCPPVFPMNYIYKVTSNSPVLWQVLTHIAAHDEDNHTYLPSTTLSFVGFMHYVWKRENGNNDPGPPGNGDSLSLINTSMNSSGVYDPTLDTTVYIFKFNYATLLWDFQETWDLGPESQGYAWTTDTGDEGAYRTISSQSELIINQGMLCNPQLNQGGHSDNEAAYMPCRETGNMVSPVDGGGSPLTANFYGITQGAAQANKVVVGNLGATDAVYRIWRYQPNNLVVVNPMPAWLNDTIGSWTLKATHTVPAGMAAALNPRVYPRDGAYFDQSNTLVLSKIELISGGPIQVLHGIRVYSLWSGGSTMHPSNGQQAGTDYWLHTVLDETTAACTDGTLYLNVFCPKTGMTVQMTSQDGYSSTYTTNGPDQCVAFTSLTSNVAKRNYRIQILPNINQGNAVMQFIACAPSEKGYTAPFLQQGVHYEIIAPPIVFTGQNFWITIVVKDTGGGTKVNYTGTSSFTSTDPLAKILGTAMDSTNYTWTLADGGVHIFINVTLFNLGVQTLVAIDTADGSISGLTAINVVAADVKLEKTPRLTVGASGDTVQFRVCWSNYSSASAFTFVINDAIPLGTVFVPEAGTANFNCGNTNGLAPGVAYSASTSTTVPPFGSWTSGNPTGTVNWLRFTIPYAGVNTTGCICYRVAIQ